MLLDQGPFTGANGPCGTGLSAAERPTSPAIAYDSCLWGLAGRQHAENIRWKTLTSSPARRPRASQGQDLELFQRLTATSQTWQRRWERYFAMLGPTAKIRVAHQWGYPYQVRM
jgi:hypothetical protein